MTYADEAWQALRAYQSEGARELLSAWSGGARRLMYQLPTGGGKTAVGVALALRALADRPESARVAWLTHRQELREQSLAALAGRGALARDLAAQPVKARSLPAGAAVLASPGLQGISFDAVGPDDLLVVDEAHHSAASTWTENFIKPWPGRVLGLTATPWRMSRREGFDHLYDRLICGPSVAELVADGWLCPVKLLGVPAEAVVKGAGRDSGGDYSASETVARNRPLLYGKLPIRLWKRSVPAGKQTVWYAPTVDAGRALTQNLNRAGYGAGMVSAGLAVAERRRLVSAFGAGSLQCLVNVAVVTEGFDCPGAACVVIARPTKSLALYLQMVGRAMRPAPRKRYAYVLDLGQSWRDPDLGHPADGREWSLAPRVLPDAELAEAPARECPQCGLVSPTGCRSCPYCGCPFGWDCAGCLRFRFENAWFPGGDVCLECDLAREARASRMAEREYTPWRSAGEGKWRMEWGRHRFLVMPSRYRDGWVAGYFRKDGTAKWRGGHADLESAQAYVEDFLERHAGVSARKMARVSAGRE